MTTKPTTKDEDGFAELWAEIAPTFAGKMKPNEVELFRSVARLGWVRGAMFQADRSRAAMIDAIRELGVQTRGGE